MIRVGWLLGCFLIAAVLSAAEGPSASAPAPQVNSILASVNGVPISLVDILPMTRNSEFQAYAVYTGERYIEEVRKIRMKAVEDRIDRLLVLEAYKTHSFQVPKQAIEEELDNIAERMGVRSRSEFTRKLRDSGTSIEKLREEVEEYMIVQIMIFDRTRIEENITPRDVFDYYQDHKEEFVTLEKMELAMIMLANNDPELETKIKTISEELAASPEKFSELARRYSVGPDSADGGKLGEIERRRLRAEFAAAMPELQAGRIYGPVRTADGVSFLRILSHTPESRGDFKSLSAEIRRRMEAELREKIRNSYLLKLREKAIVRYFF